MKTIRATGRDVVNKTGHFNYDEEKHEIAKSALLDARKPQFVMQNSRVSGENDDHDYSMETGNILNDMSSFGGRKKRVAPGFGRGNTNTSGVSLLD